MKHSVTLPVNANKSCTGCNKPLMIPEPVYIMSRDSLGRDNCKCVTCFKGNHDIST